MGDVAMEKLFKAQGTSKIKFNNTVLGELHEAFDSFEETWKQAG